MTMVRDVSPIEHLPYLAGLPHPVDDLGRLDVLQGQVEEPGLIVDARTGESRFLEANQPIPEGVWVAQSDLDLLRPDGGVIDPDTGFGEGWGDQDDQLGGERTFQEEDSGVMEPMAREMPDNAAVDYGTPAVPSPIDDAGHTIDVRRPS